MSLLRRHFDEVLNQGHTEVVDEIYAPSYVLDAPVRTDGSSADQGQTHGREGLKQRVRLFRTAFPDIHFTVDEIAAAGEQVSVQYTFSGTQRAEFAGVPPTGRSIRVPGRLVARVSGGQIQEASSTFDAQDLLRQLGVDRPR